MSRESSNKRHFIVIAVLVVIGTVITGLLMNWALPMPTAASQEASTVDGLFRLHIWLIAFLFALIMVFMFYAIAVFRRREGDDDSEGQHFEGNTALEIAWTVIPLIVVVIFSYIGITTFNTVTQKGEDLVVNVTGFQWAWTFEYGDGVVSPELVLPVNQRAKMAMTSTDVLHSFWVPEFRVKQDLVPGQTTELYFTPTVEGEYKLRCAELCGLTHWNMLATVRVVSEDEYAMWIGEQVAQVSPAVAEVAVDGVSE